MLLQRGEDDYDRIPLTETLRCTTYSEVVRRVVVPYGNTYYYEDIPDTWEKACYLAKQWPIDQVSDTKNPFA